jgi:hypothetical protein
MNLMTLRVAGVRIWTRSIPGGITTLRVGTINPAPRMLQRFVNKLTSTVSGSLRV